MLNLRLGILLFAILLYSCENETNGEKSQQYLTVDSRCIELLPQISSEFLKYSGGAVNIQDANEGKIKNSTVVKLSMESKVDLPIYNMLLDYLNRKCSEQRFYSMTYGFDKEVLVKYLSKIINLIDLKNSKANIRITSNKVEFWGMENENPFEDIDMSIIWSDQK